MQQSGDLAPFSYLFNVTYLFNFLHIVKQVKCQNVSARLQSCVGRTTSVGSHSKNHLFDASTLIEKCYLQFNLHQNSQNFIS